MLTNDRRDDLADDRASTERPLFAHFRIGGVDQACGLKSGPLAFALRDQPRVDVGVLGGRRRQLGVFVGGARLDGLQAG